MADTGQNVFSDLANPRGWPVSARYLVAANAVPVLLVFFAGWTMADLLFLYWAESAVIGFFNVLKMALSSPQPQGQAQNRASGIAAKMFMCAFFTVHFGGFMFGHGIFLSVMCRQFGLIGADPDFTAFLLGLKWPILALAVSHGYSFFANYLRGGEYQRSDLALLMQRPYPRIAVMHVTILFGMFAMLLVGRSMVILALFTALKTAADLKAHLKERSRFAAAFAAADNSPG